MKRVQISSFNANYFSAYTAAPHSFNLSLLVNFLGDGSNDTVGGSSRYDLMLGGVGANLSHLSGGLFMRKWVHSLSSSNDSAWSLAA